MKVSVSLPADDVKFLDEYVRDKGYESRSAAVHQAVRTLRASELEAAYEEAFLEWEGSPDAAFWEQAVGDGIE